MPTGSSHKIINATAAFFVVFLNNTAFGQEDPKDIIAIQVRSQGHECISPQSATEDVANSRPNEKVWILKCENANYQVKLIPDMAAHIERIK